jgi:hypothetical protein
MIPTARRLSAPPSGSALSCETRHPPASAQRPACACVAAWARPPGSGRTAPPKSDPIATADVYSGGESEEIVGKAIRTPPSRRDDVVLATKFWGAMGEEPNQHGVSRRGIISEVESSLRRLGTD